MKKLDHYVAEDPRIKKVYEYAKKAYASAGLVQHNFEHISRNLYRALVIAETLPNVSYSILISAVLLHDVGYAEGSPEEHTTVGANMIRRDIPALGFSEDEVEAIALCVAEHGSSGNHASVEAKILFDADKLEKTSLAGVFTAYQVRLEFGMSLKEFVEYVNKRLQATNDVRFYTDKAQEMAGEGYKEMQDHFEKVASALQKRPDYLITEADLWEE